MVEVIDGLRHSELCYPRCELDSHCRAYWEKRSSQDIAEIVKQRMDIDAADADLKPGMHAKFKLVEVIDDESQ